jgi:hypothetical protein
MLEHWTTSFLNRDSYLLGLTVGLIEVLVHNVAFWARVKSSAVISRLLLQIQDFEQDGEIKRKAVKVIAAISKDKHKDIPAPLDYSRYRRVTPGADVSDTMPLLQLDGVSALVPSYDMFPQQPVNQSAAHL